MNMRSGVLHKEGEKNYSSAEIWF